MNKMFLKKVLLSVLIVSIVSFGLTGCLIDDGQGSQSKESAVTIHLSSTYSDHHYNIYVDDQLYASDVTVGAKYLGKFLLGQYTFNVQHHKGPSFGSAWQDVSILNTETDVYLDVTF